MDTAVSIATGLVAALNAITPMGIIAALIYIVYQFASKKGSVNLISNNHLSGLPEMNATLLRIEDQGKRQEGTMNDVARDINYIKGRIQ